jgi:hypothetical protein
LAPAAPSSAQPDASDAAPSAIHEMKAIDFKLMMGV